MLGVATLESTRDFVLTQMNIAKEGSRTDGLGFLRDPALLESGSIEAIIVIHGSEHNIFMCVASTFHCLASTWHRTEPERTTGTANMQLIVDPLKDPCEPSLDTTMLRILEYL
jgi:hypothetical protein